MIKKLFATAFGAALAVCCLTAFTACNKTAKKTTVENFVDLQESIEYGSVYCVDDLVYDTAGVKRVAIGVAYDSYGNAVELAGNKLLITNFSGYTVKQTVTVGGQEYGRTKTLAVYSDFAPKIEIGEFPEYLYYGRTYSFPTAKASDYIDGEITGFTYEVYSFADDGVVKRETGAENYTPAYSGRQYIKVSATNSQGKVGFAVKEFTVREKAKDGEYESFSDEASVSFATLHTSIATGKKWLEEFNGKQGVAAVELRPDDMERTVLRVRPYLTDKANYEGHKYFVVTMFVEGSVDKISLFGRSDAGFAFDGTNAVRHGEWHTYLFSAEKVLAKWENITSNGPMGNLAIMRATAGKSGGTIYIDSMYFANEVEPSVKTQLSGNKVTVDITVDGKAGLFDYEVYFNGEKVAKTENGFIAQTSGTYFVVPIPLKGNTVYLGNPISVGVYFDKSDDNIGYDRTWEE